MSNVTSIAEPVFEQEMLRILERELSEQLTGKVDFSESGRALFSSDASNYRQIPLGVVFPKNNTDIVLTAELCEKHQVPVLMRGGGTSQNGQCVNVAVVIDCSQHLNKIIEIDEHSASALIEPGVICDQLKAEAEKLGLTFGPDPATHSRCTIGGMIGNNSCGPHSMMAGKTVENVLELEILTSDGARFWVGPTSEEKLSQILSKNDRQSEIYRDLIAIRDEYADQIRDRYPTIKRRVSGFNLDQLLPENGFNVARALVGSEGTCVTVLQARLKLISNPKFKKLIVLGFDDIYSAGDSVPDILPFSPIAMEGIDWAIVNGLNIRNRQQAEVALLPPGRAWLLVEIASNTQDSLSDNVNAFVEAMTSNKYVKSVLAVHKDKDITALWSIREQGASATSMSLNPDEPDPIVGWEDTAVDPYRLGDYLREFYKLVDRYGYSTSLYGHFGDGCIHARINFDTRSKPGVEKFREFSKEIATLVVQFGGSLSGEHGDGQAKAEFLPIMFGDDLMIAFQRFKQAWDPSLRMNPGKVIDAYRMDDNLRFGPEYETPTVHTALSFVHDVGGFGRSTERCIGMGKCRAKSGAMCPSYQITGEERYSTRGRAHLMHEMVRGEIIKDGWQNESIAESLDHCLSCKACKSECPTQVDIAAFKAEFMHKHYSNRRRPFSHYVLGYTASLLPYLSFSPKIANKLQQGIFGKLIKHLLGISNDAKLPVLANARFSSWVKTNYLKHDNDFYWFGESHGHQVILWADSINSHYRPKLLQNAIEVLIKSGFTVGVASDTFCCGRPLYEYGFLERGAKQLNGILDSFYSTIPKSANVVVIEPSCLSVFKDELLKLHPEDSRAEDLSARTMSLAEFLIVNNIEPKTKRHQGVLHLHCHDKSTQNKSFDRIMMQKCFEELIEPEQSCCGMAGSYGVRKSTRETGLALFARALQPTIGNANVDADIVTNGFSCSCQIHENTDRIVRHPIEVINECL